ncbi:MAG: hypothetical protein HFI89_06760 [Lachnospiraceae bacterium]|nr:hypothetical protein [Lachnospiraceae bacterium]
MKKLFQRCPVFLLILITFVLFGGISVRGEQSVYRNIPAATGYAPVCAPMFKGIHEGIYPWSSVDCGLAKRENESGAGLLKAAAVSACDDCDSLRADMVLDHESPGADSVSGNGVDGFGSVSGNRVDGFGSVSGNGVGGSGSVSENSADGLGNVSGNDGKESDSLSGPSENVSGGQNNVLDSVTEAPVFRSVGEDYFDDALFIGDSRTVGLFEYGRIEDRAQFYAQTSLMIYEVMENPKAIVETDDERGSITVEEALSEHQFGKIYIMLGLNEMGFGTPESFGKAYGAVINRIRQLQPDAVIYIQSIMHVADEKNRTDPVYNNTNIDLRNQPLKQLADNQNIFYLDVNEVLCDETGCLNSEWTFDQVHLKAAYYQIWKEFLLNHAIVRQ